MVFRGFWESALPAAGTFGIEAVTSVSALLNIHEGPKKGVYSVNSWSASNPKGMTFEMSVKDNACSLTFSWKGTMTQSGGSNTVEVEATAKDALLQPQKQTPWPSKLGEHLREGALGRVTRRPVVVVVLPIANAENACARTAVGWASCRRPTPRCSSTTSR
jgi:hypothetical protein